MTNRYTLYILTLISSFAVYLTFGTMMTVAAGVDSVPVISFVGSVLQFGLGSWLFLHWPKVGRWAAITLGIVMLIWPLASIPWIIMEGDILGWVIYGLPILLTSLVIYGHVKNIRSNEKPKIWVRVLLSLFPGGLFISYLVYLITIF